MSKSEVLKALLDQKSVSGSGLSGALGISRAAIWKSVKALREEGFEISSKTNSGYQLQKIPDILTPELISAYSKRGGWNVLTFGSLDSTNNQAKRLADGGLADQSAVISDEQTGGKGRLGRSFVSRKGLGLYLTAVLRPRDTAGDISFVTAITAVAVRRAIISVSGLSPSIKWTNDLVIGNRKLCGILTELSVEGESGKVQYMVIGIGVNVGYSPDDFPPEIRDFCTSLSVEGASVNRSALAAAILDELALCYSRGVFTADMQKYRDEYKQNCVTLGQEVSVVRGSDVRHGRAVGLDDSFGLIVDYGDGAPVIVRSGEVSVRGLYGYI